MMPHPIDSWSSGGVPINAEYLCWWVLSGVHTGLSSQEATVNIRYPSLPRDNISGG